jgi:hypothetical protein
MDPCIRHRSCGPQRPRDPVKIGDMIIGAFRPRWFGGPITSDYLTERLGANLDGMLAHYAVLSEGKRWCQCGAIFPLSKPRHCPVRRTARPSPRAAVLEISRRCRGYYATMAIAWFSMPTVPIV